MKPYNYPKTSLLDVLECIIGTSVKFYVDIASSNIEIAPLSLYLKKIGSALLNTNEPAKKNRKRTNSYVTFGIRHPKIKPEISTMADLFATTAVLSYNIGVMPPETVIL